MNLKKNRTLCKNKRRTLNENGRSEKPFADSDFAENGKNELKEEFETLKFNKKFNSEHCHIL